ncbi:hypothetical protein P154DRAFT_537192 [Amniculicola lignicola CBS 123094]|uniref:Ubiquitin conjugating enzyme n=1 Tax=Amniculicola lignicola CBS 123094 TaxID=1392246 RepID=A0A6A5W6F3_9PLEO|nr:hypothetical protein P154DRAFT_537192 [Amniculicola lignicola CBS 123094]
MGYLSHVVRRGLDTSSTMDMVKRAVSEGPKIQVANWGLALLATTFIVFIVCQVLVSYMLTDVVATLAMVETPSAAITVSALEDRGPNAKTDAKDGLLETGPEITLVHQKPITSSIRGTIRHLVQHAGKWSRFRAFGYALIYSIANLVVVSILSNLFRWVPGHRVFVPAIAGVICAPLHVAWTHKIISMPSDASWWSRVAHRSYYKNLALPAAVESSAGYLSLYVTEVFAIILGLKDIPKEDHSKYTTGQGFSILGRSVSVLAILVACYLFLCLPAHVTLVRVEASILPDEHDTIVPFDRTFDGKVVPRVLGGSGAVGFLDAWKSFNWEARRRIVKLFVKSTLILGGMFLIFAHIYLAEALIVLSYTSHV